MNIQKEIKYLIIFVFCLSLVMGCNLSNNDQEFSTLLTTGLFSQKIDHGGQEREYLIYIPKNYNTTTNIPVILNFHENGGNNTTFYNTTAMQSLADSETIILIYPQGVVGGSGTSEWNSYVGVNNKSTIDDFGFIETLIEFLKSKYTIDSSRIYAIGFSNGGMMAYALACFKSELVAAVGTVSATMMTNTITNCNPSNLTGIINIHGTYDFILPYYESYFGYASIQELLNYWVETNQISNTPTEDIINSTITHYMYINNTLDFSIEHYKVTGGYHEWLNISVNGLHTNEILWNYVSKHNTSGLIKE